MFGATFDSRLEELEQTPRGIKNIIFACAEYNHTLDNIVKKYGWQRVSTFNYPALLKMYDKSVINIKTGEIISPCKGLENYKFTIVQKAEFLMSFCLNESFKKKFKDLKVYLVVNLIDENFEIIDTLNKTKAEYGIFFSNISHPTEEIFEQNLEIDFDILMEKDKNITSINIKIIVEAKDKISNYDLLAEISADMNINGVHKDTKTTRKHIEKTSEIETAFAKFHINDWVAGLILSK